MSFAGIAAVVAEEVYAEELAEQRRERRRHGDHTRKPEPEADPTPIVMFAVAVSLGGPLACFIIAIVGEWLMS